MLEKWNSRTRRGLDLAEDQLQVLVLMVSGYIMEWQGI